MFAMMQLCECTAACSSGCKWLLEVKVTQVQPETRLDVLSRSDTWSISLLRAAVLIICIGLNLSSVCFEFSNVRYAYN